MRDLHRECSGALEVPIETLDSDNKEEEIAL